MKWSDAATLGMTSNVDVTSTRQPLQTNDGYHKFRESWAQRCHNCSNYLQSDFQYGGELFKCSVWNSVCLFESNLVIAQLYVCFLCGLHCLDESQCHLWRCLCLLDECYCSSSSLAKRQMKKSRLLLSSSVPKPKSSLLSSNSRCDNMMIHEMVCFNI